MKRIIHIAAVLLICVAFISCEREEDSRPVQSSGKPIRFTAECEWPQISKAAIDDIADFQEAGFQVWGYWSQDPNDDSNYYEDEKDVFGTYGTVVTYATSSWVCEEENEWYRGYYNFAAVAPEAAVYSPESDNAVLTCSHTSAFLPGSESNNTKYINTLSFETGDQGFDLAQNQIDLMYAFHNEDNSTEASQTVNLKFNHTFAKIAVKISSNLTPSPHIDKVRVYDIPSTVYGKLTITEVEQGENTVVTTNIAEILRTAYFSTIDNPYAEADYGGYVSTTPVPVISNLLVFPQTLTSNAMRICVDYRIRGEAAPKQAVAEVKNVIWEPGNSYVYSLTIDN